MHEPYDDEDGYDDDQYDYDNTNSLNPYKFYFKFDVGNTPLSDWIKNMFDDMVKDPFGINIIPGFPVQKFPVSNWNPDTGQGNTYQYLGSNYQGSPVWKKQYFVVDNINTSYKLHIQSHAVHFVKQPVYYRGLFDILN